MTRSADTPFSEASASETSATAPPTATAKRRVSGWIPAWSLLLSAAGCGVSIYLTVAHYTAKLVLACPATGTINCEKVTTSPESVAFGVPVAVLGLVFFAVMLPLSAPQAWRFGWPPLRRARLLAVTGGVCFVVWLIYAELFRIDAICLWCTSVHVITIALFAVVWLGTFEA